MRAAVVSGEVPSGKHRRYEKALSPATSWLTGESAAG